MYLTFLPNVPWDQTLDAVRWVAHDGMRPVPHLAARGVPDRAALRRMLAELAADGVEEVLVIAGSMATRSASSTRRRRSSTPAASRRPASAGSASRATRKGHPDVADDELTWALATKNRIARERGLDMHLVTQFTFAAEPVVAWERRHAGHGHRRCPSHVGLPGLTSPAKLLRFGLSLRRRAVAVGAAQAGRRRAQARDLRRPPPRRHPARPRCRHRRRPGRSLLPAIHFFPFGALAATAAWAVDIRDGRFEMDDRDACV